MQEIIDFDDPGQSRMIFTYMRSLHGAHRIEVKKYRPRRSDRANRFYWVAIVWPFAEWLSETYGEKVTEDDAHYLLKKTFLTRKMKSEKTGRTVELVGSSAALDTEAFGEYVEKCIRLLAEYCDITVQTPEAPAHA
jgi:hypothetical protein